MALPPLSNRVTELLGVDWPIVQAPMGYIARAPLASAVSEAGGLGVVETSSGDLEAIRGELQLMRRLTDRPFALNIAQLLVRDPDVLLELVETERVGIVTTSAGDPTVLKAALKARGVVVLHVVPTLRGALKAVAAGVDGLIVEGNEGGGFKHPRGASTMALLPLVAERVPVPVIAAGGVVDGRSMAAAFVLGAEGVQMGTRMLASTESPVHDNWKRAVVAAGDTDTVLLNRFSRPTIRALATERTISLERQERLEPSDFGDVGSLYFGGDLEAAIPFAGQAAGRITSVEPVQRLLGTIVEEFQFAVADLSRRYLDGSVDAEPGSPPED